MSKIWDMSTRKELNKVRHLTSINNISLFQIKRYKRFKCTMKERQKSLHNTHSAGWGGWLWVVPNATSETMGWWTRLAGWAVGSPQLLRVVVLAAKRAGWRRGEIAMSQGQLRDPGDAQGILVPCLETQGCPGSWMMSQRLERWRMCHLHHPDSGCSG